MAASVEEFSGGRQVENVVWRGEGIGSQDRDNEKLFPKISHTWEAVSANRLTECSQLIETCGQLVIELPTKQAKISTISGWLRTHQFQGA
jgi:hypothetical protein